MSHRKFNSFLAVFLFTISVSSYSQNWELGATGTISHKESKEFVRTIYHMGIIADYKLKKNFLEFNLSFSKGKLDKTPVEPSCICNIAVTNGAAGYTNNSSASECKHSYNASYFGIGYNLYLFEIKHRNHNFKSIFYLGLSVNPMIMKEEYTIIFNETFKQNFNVKESSESGNINFFILYINPKFFYSFVYKNHFDFRLEPQFVWYQPFDLNSKQRVLDTDSPFTGRKFELSAVVGWKF
jgi:hypothetical protein